MIVTFRPVLTLTARIRSVRMDIHIPVDGLLKSAAEDTLRANQNPPAASVPANSGIGPQKSHGSGPRSK